MSTFDHALPAGRGRRSSLRSWRWGDRIVYVLAWASGLALCLVAGALVLYLAVRGLEYVSPSLLLTRPRAEVDQSQIGGILDPLLGTLAAGGHRDRDRHPCGGLRARCGSWSTGRGGLAESSRERWSRAWRSSRAPPTS